MKKLISAVLFAVSIAGFSLHAEAKDKVQTRVSAPIRTEHSSGSGTTFGLGVSSLSAIPTPAGGLSGSVTGIVNFTSIDLIQILLSIPTTSGNFNFGLGAIYKRTMFGNANAGFHAGGGVTMGSNGAFFTQIAGVVGVHFSPGNTPIVFHLDGGPALTIQGSNVPGGTSTTSFGIGSFSNVLGASVAYLF